MRKKRFTVEQMIGVLKQAQVGVPVAEVIRKAGISEQTFYRWKAKYAGLEVDEVRKMAQLQEENLRLKRLKLERGVPKVLFCDNGSEFTSQAMDVWAYRHSAKIDFSRLGKPTDNAFVESFNGTFRCECLDTHWFMDLKEAKHLIEAWRQEYNESRPHRSLGDRTPSEFASEIAASRDLTAT